MQSVMDHCTMLSVCVYNVQSVLDHCAMLYVCVYNHLNHEECTGPLHHSVFQVTYHNLTRAVQLSREEKKPLHTVILWGALDDQSC